MSDTKAYQLGRLLAALEHIGATGDGPRLYEMASIDPAQMTPVLAKATAAGESGQDVLLPIMAELPADAFEDTLSNEEQSAFALGYYHQRGEFRRGNLPALDDSEPAQDETMLLRIDNDLKAWVLAHGGSKLIRSLLRQARGQPSAE